MTRPDTPILVDASPLIGLARIERLDLLAMFPLPIYVTRAVWREVADDPGRPGASSLIQAKIQGVLSVIDAGDEEAYGELDAGENSTLSAAAQLGAFVIIDERKARERILRDAALRTAIGAPLTTIGLVIRAKHQGLVPAVRPVLDELRRERFWISQADYEDALHIAGEL
ncbi:MAG: DUF3368 domain-containing protein [Chloroflexota bacterium]|nr:DUF3368 domain-containing protein [Chloroflexota bacterium]